MSHSERPVTDLAVIAAIAAQEEAENERFTRFLKASGGQLDDLVMAINADVEPQVSCIDCGNCCRSLIIHVEPADIPPLAEHLAIDEAAFASRYLEKGMGDAAVVSQVPCHFLSGNCCTVYPHRFSACRSFPHLDVPGVATRAFALMQQVGRCPIVFNVIKLLKSRTGFC